MTVDPALLRRRGCVSIGCPSATNGSNGRFGFRGAPVAETLDLDEYTVLDFDAQGNVCAITVEHASKRASRRSLCFPAAALWAGATLSETAAKRDSTPGFLEVALLPEYRENGIGRELMKRTIDAAWAQGLSRNELAVRALNARPLARLPQLG